MIGKEAFIEMVHQDIPLTKMMGIDVVRFDDNCLCLSAPLSINANHKNTFFGGSLYTLAVTTGWGLMYLKMKELGCNGHVVINDASIKYDLPVTTDVISRCEINEQQIRNLERQLSRRGKGVMTLDVGLGENDESRQVNFSGRYAIV